jgi:hypothetical protein
VVGINTGLTILEVISQTWMEWSFCPLMDDNRLPISFVHPWYEP